MNHFEAASLSTSTLLVKKLGDDKTEQTAEYTLVMDFNAVAKAQEHLGRDLSRGSNWNDLTGSEITVVCWCAFDRFYPEVTLREVRQMLTPAQSSVVCDMLLEMCFPGVLQRIADRIKEKQAEGSSPDPTIAVKS
jgi:hypothetical protein